MTFQEKLVILRKARGLTQDDFASAVGVSRQAVYKWESGQSYPEVQKLLEMKSLFSISIDDLLDDNYDVPLPEKKKRKRAPKAEKAAEAFAPVEEPKVVAAPKAAEPAEKVEAAVTEPKESVEAAKLQEMDAFKVVINNEPKAEEKEDLQEEKKSSFFGRFFNKK